jgi:hypothetical protein
MSGKSDVSFVSSPFARDCFAIRVLVVSEMDQASFGVDDRPGATMNSSSNGISRRAVSAALLLAALPLSAVNIASADRSSADLAGQKSEQAPDKVAKVSLKVGDTAPDFALLSDQWKPVKLSDFHGKKNVLLAVYVLAFTGG